ncbi:MAG: orotidine-5'-phosphate decarboxylase [Negativicutes bacterium]|nr:orotidine-5'-phosphate decarboxylase [Negativicutes bacterium]
MNAMTRLWQRGRERLPFCVGLDTAADYLPEDFRRQFAAPAAAVAEFNRRIIDATCELVAGFKVQIAYYEAAGVQGMAAYADTLSYLRQRGTVVIADVKRGDIAATARQYAQAHFTGDFAADIITLNPYLGFDSLEEYFPYFAAGKGGFVLLQTSNPGWRDIQALAGTDGRLVCEVVAGRLLAIAAGQTVDQVSPLGVVVGCTEPGAAGRWRQRLEGMMVLIPGYGAQGGSPEVVRALLGEERRGVVNLSRAVLLAWRRTGGDFAAAARAELVRLAAEAGYGL